MKPRPMSPPMGCRLCGVAEREHCRRWVATNGSHQWQQPTQAQILARMRARRIDRQKGPDQ